MPARVNPDVPGEPRLLRKVGKRIRELREKKGLTMAELGASAGKHGGEGKQCEGRSFHVFEEK